MTAHDREMAKVEARRRVRRRQKRHRDLIALRSRQRRRR